MDAFDAVPVSIEPEVFKPVFHKLRKKEKSLRIKAQELENKLEMSEIHNYSLVEENCELKTEIESLETEISEVSRHGFKMMTRSYVKCAFRCKIGFTMMM